MGRGRCKAFNPVTQSGNCIFGSNCRYAHPEDPDWATALPAPLRNDPISSNNFGTSANTTPWTSNGRYSNTNSSMNNTSNSNNSNGWGPPSDSQIAGSSKDASSTGWDRFGSSDWGKTGSSNETSSGWGAASTSKESQTRGGPEASSSSSGNGNGWGTNTGSISGGNEWGSSGSRNEERSAPTTSPTKRSTRDGGHRNTVSWEDGHRNDSTSRSKDSVNEGGSGWGDKDRSSTIRSSGDRHSSRAGASTSWDETRSNSGPSRTHDSSSNNTIRSVGPFGKMNTSSNDSPQYTSQINASPRARSHSGSTNGGRPQDQSSSSHHHSDRQGSRRGLSYATSSSVSSDPRRARADSFTRQQDDIDVDVVPSSPTTPLSPSHGLSSSHSHTSMARKESNGSVSPVVNPLKRKRSEHHSDQGNRTPKRSQDEGVEITENALTEFLR
ncbi:hypothetical protein FRC03_004816 [Tulasnella sp. 419]|nr:hypothetical protein FRC03_004816 [Tulasnella sp. 419]